MVTAYSVLYNMKPKRYKNRHQLVNECTRRSQAVLENLHHISSLFPSIHAPTPLSIPLSCLFLFLSPLAPPSLSPFTHSPFLPPSLPSLHPLLASSLPPSLPPSLSPSLLSCSSLLLPSFSFPPSLPHLNFPQKVFNLCKQGAEVVQEGRCTLGAMEDICHSSDLLLMLRET